jgi:DNA-binding NtrC family response regulator
MKMQPTVLIVEDSKPMAMAYKEFLRNDELGVHCVETLKEARVSLSRSEPDIVLLDLQLPDGSGLELLKHLNESGAQSTVIVISAHGSIETAVSALKVGADDFLEKPFTAERLRTTISNVMEKKRLSSLVANYERQSDRDSFYGFIGSSLAMQGVYHMVESAAPSKATVFITGESGTGKEVLAQAVHACSPRSEKPFVALNCAAIPRELMESEIFGHIKGAFTGAAKERKGAALLADGGTLFLDEVCEMDLELQAKLLRFLQTETYRPVGSDTEQQVDVRIICATNKNPQSEVDQGNFREDLFYRLHVIPIDLPPLRERGQDILAIANSFLQNYAAEENKEFETISTAAQDCLLNYSWPGNIRQMQNIFRQAVVLNNGQSLELEMLPAVLNGTDAAHGNGSDSVPQADATEADKVTELPAAASHIAPLWEVEQTHIINAIKVCGDNVPKAAALLEVSPSTLYRRTKDTEQGKNVNRS